MLPIDTVCFSSVTFQAGNGTFNRAKLLNVGVREALRDEEWDCLFLHDVDLLPENDHNLYVCDPRGPRHVAVAMNKFGYRYRGHERARGSREPHRPLGGEPRGCGWGCLPKRLVESRHLSLPSLPYPQYFGGVSALTPDQYLKMNGFPNEYWGWGGEDDDIATRSDFLPPLPNPHLSLGACPWRARLTLEPDPHRAHSSPLAF